MWIIKHRNFFFGISILAVTLSLISVWTFGLNLGMDFKGGTMMEVEYATVRPAAQELETVLAPMGLGNVSFQPAGEKGMIVKLRSLSEVEHASTTAALSLDGKYPVIEKNYSSIGPTLGAELARKGLVALALALLFIIIFIAFAFRGVSRPVSSWKYGLIAIIALIHDISVPTGVFAILGHYRGIEVDGLFLTALLTVFALSVNDTIVIFDRVRENLKNRVQGTFEEVVGRSLNETIVRSLNTSLAVIFMLLALFLFGSESTKSFSLALLIGMTSGTYSSVFIAAPLLVLWEKLQTKKVAKK
jgi:preprotein translocase subunit SecF